jgi:hypothetical protein
MMRMLVAAFCVIVLAGAPERGVAEPEYPWCAELFGDEGSATNCGFMTLEQCMATVRGAGGYCRANPLSSQRPAEPRRPDQRQRARTN